jgi:hypothetical protein
MHELIWTAFVCGIVYLAMWGWGEILLRGLHMRQPGDIGLAGAIGMAFLCTLGGVLNLAQWISTPVVMALLSTGWIAVVQIWARGRTDLARRMWARARALYREPMTAALLVIAALLVVFFVFSTGARPLNGHDDQHAYLVFPQRMLEVGSIGEDPFNERRMNSWGGQSFLQALMLPMVDSRNLGALDGGVGWIVFVVLVLSHARRKALTVPASAALLLFWHANPPPAVNLSSLVTGMSLFYGYTYLLFDERSRRDWRGLVLSALFVAGSTSLKNSLIPGLVCMSLVLVLGDSHQPPRQRWLRLVGIAIVAGLFCVPWMLSMYESSGTALYPILGRGVHGFGVPLSLAPPMSVSANALDVAYLAPILWAVVAIPTVIPGVLLLGASARNRSSFALENARRGFLAAVLATLLLVITALGLVRYSYPCAFAAFSFLALETIASHARWRARGDSKRAAPIPDGARFNCYISPEWRPWVALLAFVLLAAPSSVDSFATSARQIRGFRVPAETSSEIRSVRAAQLAVPEGQSLLAVLSYPHALDFGRNAVFVVDHAGSAAPSPGLPLADSAAVVASYLARQGVRYVMYSYADEARYGRGQVRNRLASRGTAYRDRVRALASNNIRFRDQLMELATLYTPIHDDGYVFVLDLAIAIDPAERMGALGVLSPY